MVTFVSRNTIQLASNASAIDDYYLGHKISLTRTDSLGRSVTQTKNIIGYVGASKIATIDGIWEQDYVPAANDTYTITPKYEDHRVSINPAMQTMDYITSKTYGRGLDPIKDLQLDSWLESGRICDTRSDIYVKFTGTAPAIGAKYTIGSAIWQGTVAEIIGNYIRFTDVIGKLSYKWNSWRNYKVGSLLYQDDRLYNISVAGVKNIAPAHTSGTVDGMDFLSTKDITLVSGTGPATLGIYTDGNPVRFEKNGVAASGYTLYDSDGIDYFRLIGWDQNEQRSVTRHQTNISIDTSIALFDNTNSMLQHFGGILRYSGDKYILEVEQTADPIANVDNQPYNITSDHIIGKIAISDEGIKNSYNSLTVSYSDPSTKFEARNISFFNSNFLKADRNIPKKGSVSIPGISNYYNARILADKYLNKSRYGLTISMNLVPRGTLLLAGRVIQLQYPRYGWIDKKFRIENLTHTNDCTVDVVATEYDDSFYVISNIAKPPAVGVTGTQAMTTIDPPTGLTTTNVTDGNELVSAIELSWQDSASSTSPNVETQIYASYSRHLQINVISITGGTTLTTNAAHDLKVGQTIIPLATSGIITANTLYYVKSVPSATTFTLSSIRNGADIVNITNTSTAFSMITATVIASVKPPINSFVDSDIFDTAGNRVQKYYWLRYKINVV